MGRFLDELDLRFTQQLEGGRPVFKLLARFRYQYGKPACGGLVDVQKGFLTDLSSVPRLLWRVCPPWSGQQAAVIHDYLYTTQHLDRALSDAIFRTALADSRVGPFRRWLMWAAVRLFGGHVYRKNRKLQGASVCDPQSVLSP